MSKIKFSIILTTYNSAPFIEKTIKSIINQKGANFLFDLEIIVVDDFSKDNTIDVVKKYDVFLITKSENSGGPNHGRNIGLEKASGDWVIIADHDDLWYEKRLYTTLKYLDKAQIISSGYSINYDFRLKNETKSSEEIKFGIKNYFLKNETFLKIISRSKFKKQPTYLGSLCFKNANPPKFEEKYNQVDFDWIAKLFEHCDSYYIPQSLYTRYQHENNLSRNENYRLNDFKHSLDFYSRIMNKYPNEVKKGIKRLNGTMARYYYAEKKFKRARQYFLKAEFSMKILLYYLTSFWGHHWVNKRFKVFD